MNIGKRALPTQSDTATRDSAIFCVHGGQFHLRTEVGIAIYSCAVCHADESREEYAEEIFRTSGKYVLIKNIPAKVCVRCGEETFSAKTAESIRVMVNKRADPETSIAMDVFTFAPQL